MLSSCLGLDTILCKLNHMLSLSCYKIACHYFLHLLSTLCTNTCYFTYFAVMLCCSEDKEFFDEDFL
jgi:hypothetical protein